MWRGKLVGWRCCLGDGCYRRYGSASAGSNGSSPALARWGKPGSFAPRPPGSTGQTPSAGAGRLIRGGWNDTGRQSQKNHRGVTEPPQLPAMRARIRPTEMPEGHVEQKQAWLEGEPTIDDVMADPIVHVLMRSDGVGPEEVWETVRIVSNHLREQRRQPVKAA